MIRKCFDEEVNASNKNCKVNGSAVCFLYNAVFLCYFYSGSSYCFNQLFSSGKSGWLWKEPVVEWCGKWSRRRHKHCSKWPPSAWTQASSLVHHWSVASSTTLCWNSRHVATSCCCNVFFCISLGSAVTFFRWSVKIYSQLVSSFLRSLCIVPKIIEIGLFLTDLFQK